MNISVSSDDETEGSVSPASLTFTPSNWNTPQQITVTGVDDFVMDGDINFNVIIEVSSTSDVNYGSLAPISIEFTNTDDDYPDVIASAISGNTTESSGTASFTVTLSLPPTSDVLVPLSSSDTTEGVVSPTSLTFTPDNWNAPQTIIVTGVDDMVSDGDKEVKIDIKRAVSNDPKYNLLNPPDIVVINIDND